MNRVSLGGGLSRAIWDTGKLLSFGGVVTRSFTNRLETRTKESTECASVRVIEAIQRGMKVTFNL